MDSEPPIPAPPLDPELATIVETMPLVTITPDLIPDIRVLPPGTGVSPEQYRELGLVRRDVVVPGYQGFEMTMTLICRDDHSVPGPGIYNTHGGGMISGDRFSGIQPILPWIVEHDAVAVTVEYRLAPEFPDPYPVEDCYAGLIWMANHASDLLIDPERIIIAGVSAGGGLAAGTALAARDRNGPSLIGQVLMCPMLDDRDDSASTLQYQARATWNRGSNRTAWRALLGDRAAGPDVSIYAAPARATDLSGLPPVFIDCGSAEVFRDEDLAFASRLWEAGVQAELHVWAGGFHGFDLLAPESALARAGAAARDDWVRRLFAHQ